MSWGELPPLYPLLNGWLIFNVDAQRIDFTLKGRLFVIRENALRPESCTTGKGPR